LCVHVSMHFATSVREATAIKLCARGAQTCMSTLVLVLLASRIDIDAPRHGRGIASQPLRRAAEKILQKLSAVKCRQNLGLVDLLINAQARRYDLAICCSKVSRNGIFCCSNRTFSLMHCSVN